MKTLTSRFCPSYLGNKKGSLLVWIALLLIIISAAIGATIWIVGSKSRSGKISSTVGSVDAAVNAVISWAVPNKSLPDAATFPTLLSNPNDPWGKPFIYIYDSNLTSTATGGICGRTTTSITASVPTGTTSNVAFIVLSGGDNYTVDSTPNVSGAFSGAATMSQGDIYKVVTLEELKQKAGCYGTTGGSLTILNTQLPSVCLGASYSAIVAASGGVPLQPSNSYNWTVTNAPSWLQCNGVVCGTHNNTPSITLSASSATSAATISFIVTDNNSNTFQRDLTINLSSSASCPAPPPPPGSQVTLATPFATPVAPSGNLSISQNATNQTLNIQGTGNGQGCIWYSPAKTLSGKKMRAYFKTKFLQDNQAQSKDMGDGFVFALIDNISNTTSSCGGVGNNIGYSGGTIIGNSIAVEVDIYPDASKNDPTNYNHVAIVKDGNNKHDNATSPFNPSCPSAGCVDNTSSVTWLEDGIAHPIRVELNATAGTGSNATMKVWVNCYATGCDDLTQDYGGTASATHTYTLPAAMANVYFGFTTASSGNNVQTDILSNFGIGFYGPTCTLTASPSSVAAGGGTTTLNYTITDGPDNGTWTVSPGGTCANLTNSGSGSYSCTTASLTPPKTFTLNLSSSNGNGSCSATVTASCPSLSITTASPLPDGRVNVAYTPTTINASGGTTPYSWSSSGLPTGLSINSSGVISGTPTAWNASAYTPTITVTDSCPQSVNPLYSLRVKTDTYNIVNNTGVTIYPDVGGCKTSNAISNGSSYQISYNSGTVTFYQTRGSGNSCSGSSISISGANADANDLNYNGNVQINSSWQRADQ